MRKDRRKLSGKHVAISVFILFQSTIILASLFPVTPWLNWISDATNRYRTFFGFDQTFAVFSSPRIINKYLCGLIVYKSGLVELYDYPRVERFEFLDKLRFERYRKFFSDNLDSSVQQPAKIELAKFIARTHNTTGDPPSFVSLWIVVIPIPPPEGAATGHRTFTRFLDYTVKESDLR